MPEPDWLVEGMVVRQGLTLLYGPSKVNKTTFCLYLINALDDGKSVFGRKCKKTKVLLIEQDQSPPITGEQKHELGRPKKLTVVKEQIKYPRTIATASDCSSKSCMQTLLGRHYRNIS